MALDVGGSRMLLGECKYRNAKTDNDTLHSLRLKYPIPPGIEAFHCLFSKSGFTKRLQDEAKEKGVRLIEMTELVM